MKIKKFLEKVAEEDRESLINDGDIEFLASIGVDYNKKKVAAQNEPEASYYLTARAFNYRALLIGLVCLIVAALAVSLSLYFYFKKEPVEPPIQYFEDNFDEVESNLQELNADLKLFSLSVDEDIYELVIKKTYDSLSGDNLFFTLEFTANQGLKYFRLDIVVNSLYEHEGLSYTNVQETQLSGDYTLKFYENSSPMSGTPFTTVTGKGEIKIGEQWVYITRYEERALGQSTFVETLQSIISFN